MATELVVIMRPLPPPPRRGSQDGACTVNVPDATMSSLLYLSSELILRICAELDDDARAVARLRQTNRRLHALAGDAMLWKRMFTHAYLLEDTARSRPAKRRRVEVRDKRFRDVTMPTLDAADDVDRRIDWYTLYKVSHNWQTGNYTAHQLRTALDASTSAAAQESAIQQHHGPDLPDTIVEASQRFVFTASRRADVGPARKHGQVLVFPTSVLSSVKSSETGLAEEIQQESLAAFTSACNADSPVSALAVDRGCDGDRTHILVANTSGALSVASFDSQSQVFSETAHKAAGPGSSSQSDTVVMAAFHWPYVATCTIDFRIRIYRVAQPSSQLVLVEERRSYSCHWPACLRLAPVQSTPAKMCLNIAYCNAVYPTGWTVGVQEVVWDSNGVLGSRSASAKRSHVVTRIDASSSSSPKAIGKRTLKQERIDQLHRLTSLSYEYPFVVVGTRDNDVYCFRVEGAAADASKETLSVQHLRTLHGHTGTVHSVSLDGGRCVTGGSDGSVRVWRLGDEERSIARATGLLATLEGRLRRGGGGGGEGSVVTLQRAASQDKKRRRGLRDGVASPAALTLADIVRHAGQAASLPSTLSSSSSVIRWVASAFDRIISVSASTAAVSPAACRREAAAESIAREEEQVQIWSFSA